MRSVADFRGWAARQWDTQFSAWLVADSRGEGSVRWRPLEPPTEAVMAADPDAFRTKFRKMAAEPFAFYRGSACLFYADVAAGVDRWADERTSRAELDESGDAVIGEGLHA